MSERYITKTIRFSDAQLAELERESQLTGKPVATLAHELIMEGIRRNAGVRAKLLAKLDAREIEIIKNAITK